VLEHLFGSKTRVKLLRLFLHNPGQPYFVRELTRKVGAQINAVRNELEHLVAMGIVHVAADVPNQPAAVGAIAQRKYYQLDPACPMCPELQALFAKDRHPIEQDFARRLSTVGSVSYLAFTGFFVGSTSAPTDLLIVGRVDQDKLVPLMRNFERELGREVNYTVMTVAEFRYRKEIADRFLYAVLDESKAVLVDTIAQERERAAAPAL
jgi:hypothetical protein